MNCRKCNGKTIKNGKDTKGYQTYRCKECGHIWSDKVYHKNWENTENITCHKCESPFIRREGKTKDGRQRYKCKVCGYRFTEDMKCKSQYSNPHPITASELRQMATYRFNLRIPAREIAKSFKKPIPAVEKALIRVKSYMIKHKVFYANMLSLDSLESILQ